MNNEDEFTLTPRTPWRTERMPEGITKNHGESVGVKEALERAFDEGGASLRVTGSKGTWWAETKDPKTKQTAVDSLMKWLERQEED